MESSKSFNCEKEISVLSRECGFFVAHIVMRDNKRMRYKRHFEDLVMLDPGVLELFSLC